MTCAMALALTRDLAALREGRTCGTDRKLTEDPCGIVYTAHVCVAPSVIKMPDIVYCHRILYIKQ